jgi:ADP-ribose pyrophosphatase YjhB (NUDIX family)
MIKEFLVMDVWSLPGGIVKSGESLENAFTREVKERDAS